MYTQREYPSTATNSPTVESLLPTVRVVPQNYRNNSIANWRFRIFWRLVYDRFPAIAWMLPRFMRPIAYDIDLLGDLFESKLKIYQSLFGQRPRSFLEFGPGESVARALIASSYGIERTWLIDAADYATRDMSYYHALAAELTVRGLVPADISRCSNRQEILFATGASYLTEGLSSLRQIPDRSIDLIMSEAVLEHIPAHLLPLYFAEFERILSPCGIGLHGIDLHDHLDGGLDNLRFSPAFWQKQMVRNSSFYTNRLSRSQIVALAQNSSLACSDFYRLEWPTSPISKRDIHSEIRAWSENDLKVCSFGLAIQPKNARYFFQKEKSERFRRKEKPIQRSNKSFKSLH